MSSFYPEPPKVILSDRRKPEPKAPQVPVYVGLHKLLKENMAAITGHRRPDLRLCPPSAQLLQRPSPLQLHQELAHRALDRPRQSSALQLPAAAKPPGPSSPAPQPASAPACLSRCTSAPPGVPSTANPSPRPTNGAASPATTTATASTRKPSSSPSIPTSDATSPSPRKAGPSYLLKAELVYDPVQQALPEPVSRLSSDPSPYPDPEAPTTPIEPEAALATFRKLLRLDQPQHEATWKTLLNWVLAAMRPAKNAAFHDYPILNLVGPADSGKSVAAKIIAQLIDPTDIPLHSLPTTERKLHVLAAAHHVLAFDNPGKINPEKSRYLSRLSTGVGSLYSQFLGPLVRPIILTTRTTQETRHLSTRVVDVELPRVQTRLSQQEIWEEFEKLRPQILGALLTLLSQTFDAPPAHLPNRKTKRQKIEESIPLLIQKQGGGWQGTVTDLQQALNLPVTTHVLGRYLKKTEFFEVTSKKSNKVVTLTITSRPV